TDYCIAVSQTNDPTGSYNVYRVPAQPVGGEFHDYPHTGVGDSYIVVGANQFGGSIPNGFEGRIWALDKSVMYSGGVLSPVTASVGYDGGTPQPLTLHGFGQGTWPSFGSTHYIATDFYDGCRLDIWQWNIPSAPSIVATFDLCTATGVTGGMPVDYPQSGGSPIQANDWRMRGFEYRNGSGWIADSISCNPGGGTVDCARWTEVDLTGGTPTLAQAGVYASTGEYRTFPDLAVNQCNDMAIGYTKSSSSMFPSIWYSGRESGDPAGTLQAEAQLKAGEIAYIAFDGTPYRWGDYTGMTIDPDGTTFWYLGEYSKNTGTSSGRWGTYIGSFSYPDCGSVSNPQVQLTKTVGTDPGICAATNAITVTEGTDVTYCYSIENTGDVTFTLHTLTDSELGDILVDFPYQLVPGASAFITQTANITTTTTNTAIWTASDPGGPSSAADSDSATVTVPPAEVGVSNTELVITQVVDTVVSYTLTINNPGGTSLDWTLFEDTTAAPLEGQGAPERLGTSSRQTPPASFVPTGVIVGDGGFETGTPNAVWSEYSTNFNTPICDVGGCGAGGGTGPHTGNWWAWFGGIGGTYEEGSITQTVTIPSGSASLTFWLEVPVVCDSTSDYMAVLIDGNQVYQVDGSSALCGVVGYSLQTVDISAYADGGSHNLEFYSETFSTNSAVTNFFVDDVAIDVVGAPAACSTANDIPWVTVNPVAGTVAPGAEQDVQIGFDTTGLSLGTTYTGTLCLTSNDPVNPLIAIPLTVTLETPVYGVALSPAQAIAGDAGTTVVYTVTITNIGNTVDTFDLTASGTWTATPSQTTITLDSGEAATFTVEVTIPSNASDGETDVTTVTATSQNDVTATAESELTTTAVVVGYPVFLPIVIR
ncbi:MAG TPA: hypothetical protein PK530_07260, partial [Anaerolineales bacterium]|nr:hypothetical protein [Anaerolineales bacterium]